MIFSKIPDFYKRYEKYISPIGLIYGFIFTTLTLTRVDMFIENFWIIVHLLLAAGAILALTFYENRADQKAVPLLEREKFHFYLTLVIQFAFGGLFSTFFVFYLRSSSIFESWFLLLILIILLVGNELWKKHYARLVFQICVLFISIYLFLIFLLPVLWHRLGVDLFVASGIISLLIITLFSLILRRFAKEKFRSGHPILRVSLIGILLLMNGLYFFDIMPPIPLSLKNAGVFHSVIRTVAGNYQVTGEPKNWSDYFTFYPTIHLAVGESAYVFTSIFSPVAFSTTIIHEWQYYDENKKDWVSSAKIVLPIKGGRENGYRTYSMKSNPGAGRWRVKVLLPNGQTIGRVNFTVEEAEGQLIEDNLISMTF